MKFAIAVCSLLFVAAGCSALELPGKDVVLSKFMGMQQKVMRSMISAQKAGDDPNLLNLCFGDYMSDQRTVLESYNTAYSGCVTTSQKAKSELTAQSEQQRNDLLGRSDSMCTNLGSCDSLTDGLEFFACYRDASTDSYKLMFTLNNDANVQYNKVSSQYSLIESDLDNCLDVARMDYAHDLEVCDNHFNDCMSGDSVRPEPTTEAPIIPTDEPEEEQSENLQRESSLIYKNALKKLKPCF